MIELHAGRGVPAALGAAVVLLGLAGRFALGDAGSTYAFEHKSPPDCHVAAQPTGGNPNAPTDLDADLPPFQFLGQTDVAWTDNSDNESCFVVERKFVDQEYELIAILPPNTTEFRDVGPYDQGDWLFYRAYAATSTQRSFYSNEDSVTIPIVEPTPTGSPPTPPPYRRGDLNCDQSIDPRDALVLLRSDAGLDPNLPFQCPSLDTFVQVTPSASATLIGIGALGFGAAFLVARRRVLGEHGVYDAMDRGT